MTIIEQQTQLHDESIASCIQGIDSVEFYVSNASQAAQYYRTTFGFTPIAYAGLETGSQDRVSYVLQLDKIYLVLTSPLRTATSLSASIERHGDSVKDIALRVSDVDKVFAAAIKRGAKVIQEPTVYEDKGGHVIKATIGAFGDVVHSFIQREEFTGAFWPTYQSLKTRPAPWTGLQFYDHFALSLPHGTLQQWVKFYTHTLEFHPIHEESVATAYSSMNSVAVQDHSNSIKFVLVEPIPGKRTSQVEEYLKFHGGPGVQHIALHTQDIIKTIHVLRDNGIDFVAAPPASYYKLLPERVGAISENINALQESNILVDRDEWGYLLQIFSLPIQPRPTLFMEIIQRHDARGFGSGNIRALFEAVEQEQMRRGTL